ncbi:MAG: type I DNA topoisomerase [Bacteroidales bacterium]|jgi:DNA topoisomerase-1|nr:type I DNA topoisomerase [Bacteroidales bacterium]
MANNLVIVESPAKAKTIEKYLGKDFHVVSSFGHIRDLDKKNMGIKVENDFEPVYIISDDKKKVVANLKSEVKKADTVWLASDDDREGEAIAWHLFEVLGLRNKDTKRIVFNEITKKAILDAIANPREIDQNLVNAQQARRILDRIVGFEISPVLWTKVKGGLSAGRVQSVAVRLVCEREEEIKNFVSKDSYNVKGIFNTEHSKTPIAANLNKNFNVKEEAVGFLNHLINATFTVANTNKKPSKRAPQPPFTTSTLQQEAFRKLGMSVERTMLVAQQLYEAGLITYMRTDSVNLSDYAVFAAKEFIEKEYGSKYSKIRHYKTKTKGAQEAHEAIRPTDLSRKTLPDNILNNKLYELIWKRTVASQMADAEIEITTIDIAVSQREEMFVAKGEVIIFDGYLKLYSESVEKDEQNVEDEENLSLPAVKKNEEMYLVNAVSKQTFTAQPTRYNEAMLVHKLEELGIGRPSTYAPIISTIQKRNYVIKGQNTGKTRQVSIIKLEKGTIKETSVKENYASEKNKLLPTDIGEVVNKFLCRFFINIMDYNFTANAEKELDTIAEGKLKWQKMLETFYTPFHNEVVETSKTAKREKAERLLGKDPKTGKNVFAKIGRFGAMIQIGEVGEEEKPVFASLQSNQSISTITLEEALSLFALPRNLGKYENEDIIVSTGRFGAYVKFGNKLNVSLPKNKDPYAINLDESIELIKAKQKSEAQKQEIMKHLPKTLGRIDDKDVVLNHGRFGAYVTWNGKNYKVARKDDFLSLTFEEAKAIIKSSKSKK